MRTIDEVANLTNLKALAKAGNAGETGDSNNDENDVQVSFEQSLYTNGAGNGKTWKDTPGLFI